MAKGYLKEVIGIFTKLAPQQKIILGVVGLVTLVVMIVLFSFLNQPTYSTLFAGLNEEDAASIVDQLNAQKVSYKLENGGTTIKVPEENVHELRLQVAAKGIPSSGVVGYEIFDGNTFGMSEFMQKLNYKRALEGELARTIMEQEGIEAARVHIVTPEKSVFKDEQENPTASVVLKLKGSYSLDKENITAILNLVASSVEGLKQNRVTLMDTQGRLLSRDNSDIGLSATTSKQYELKQIVEKYLSQKAQRLLDNVVGFGNSMVQVDIDLDFDQVEKTMTSYDPDSQVAISEQSIKSQNSGTSRSDSSAQLSENNTVNYEISQTIQRVIHGTGTIKRLSVATVVNEVPKKVENEEGGSAINYEPRSEEQLQKLEQIVKNSVGYSVDRKDNFSLVSIPFEANSMGVMDSDAGKGNTFFDINNYEQMTNIIIVIAGIIASLIVVRSLMARLKKEKILVGTPNTGQLAFGTVGAPGFTETQIPDEPAQLKKVEKKQKQMLPPGDLEDEISDDAVLKKNQQEKIANYVQKNPIEAAKLINYWLHEDELS